jgi:uncharacterized protein YndB with AHSA1/START domain
VWKALTDPHLLARWLMPNDFKLEVGRRFTFRTEPIPSVRFGGTAYCQVLEFEAEKLLRISWAERGEENGLDSTVTWRLQAEGKGTRLFLEHDGFDPDNPYQQLSRRFMGGGWPEACQRIAQVLAAAEVTP